MHFFALAPSDITVYFLAASGSIFGSDLNTVIINHRYTDLIALRVF